jgi:RimJ/RimL family protein N-acetyltransferase
MARIAGRLRDRGVVATLRKAFADKVFRHSTSVMIELRPEWHQPGRNEIRPDWLSFAVARQPADLPPLCDWMAWRRGDFRDMLNEGKVGIFALRDGVAVGCAWFSLSDHRDTRSREFYAVGPNEAYHYCWMIDPALRRSNIALPFGRFMLKTLGEMGIGRRFGLVDRANRTSYVLQARFGYRECGIKVMHYVIFGSRWTRIAHYEGLLGPLEPRAAR